MAYIAARPVHFDREYKIGEIIPPEAIDPAMSRKLIEMGKIIEVSLPEPKKQEPEPTGEGSPETTPDAAESAEGTSTPAGDAESAEVLTGRFNAEQLAAWKNAELEKLAADLGVDISKAKNKAERAQLIAAAEIRYPKKAEEAGEGFELPDE